EWADTPTELHERSQSLSKAEEDFGGLLEPTADVELARTRRDSASDLALALREARAARESSTEVEVDFRERASREAVSDTVRPGPSWGLADFLRRGVAKPEQTTVAGDWGTLPNADADADSSATTGVTSEPQLSAAAASAGDDADADSSAT